MPGNRMKSLTATNLRLILIVSIFLLVILSAISFWFFRTNLVSFAQQVHSDNAAASISSSDISRLEQLKRDLEKDKVAVTRAKNIVADSKYYQYQDQIINDITAYASKAGVSITSFAFSGQSGQGAGAADTTGAAPQQTSSNAPPGLKTISTTVTIKSPTNYKAVMQFIHFLELNLTKMQLSGISLTKGLTAEDVMLNPITIEVYVK